MRKISKSLLVTALMAIMIGFIVCVTYSDVVFASQKVSFAYDYDTVNSNVEQIASYFAGMSDAEIDYYISNTVGMNLSAFESYKNVKAQELGELVSAEKCNIKESKEFITAKVLIHFSKKDINMTVKFQYISGDVIPTDITFELADTEGDTSFGQKMSKAGLNTLMGMGTVFLVLIFLSLVISLFKIIYNVQNGKKKEVSVPVINNNEVEEDEEEYIDDLEIVAVITAAIAASQGGSTDGFVVRSIKRSKKNMW